MFSSGHFQSGALLLRCRPSRIIAIAIRKRFQIFSLESQAPTDFHTGRKLAGAAKSVQVRAANTQHRGGGAVIDQQWGHGVTWHWRSPACVSRLRLQIGRAVFSLYRLRVKVCAGLSIHRRVRGVACEWQQSQVAK